MGNSDRLLPMLHAPRGIVRSDLVLGYDFVLGPDPQVLYDRWGVAQNHGRLGSTPGADANDPAWNAFGLAFGADDYVYGGNTGLTLGALQLVFRNAEDLTAVTTTRKVVNLETTGGQNGVVAFGACTSSLTNEIIQISDSGHRRVGWCDGAAVVPAGTHCLDITWDSKIARYAIILDGQRKPTLDGWYGGIQVITLNNLLLGREAGSGYCPGYEMGYLLLYSRPLSMAELAHNREYLRWAMACRGGVPLW